MMQGVHLYKNLSCNYVWLKIENTCCNLEKNRSNLKQTLEADNEIGVVACPVLVNTISFAVRGGFAIPFCIYILTFDEDRSDKI